MTGDGPGGPKISRAECGAPESAGPRPLVSPDLANLAIGGSFRHNHRVSSESPASPGSPAASSPAERQTWTILEVLRWTQARFERQGNGSARLDAELLATQAFGRSRVELYAHFDQPLDEHELAAYRGLVQRRLGGEPVAYILGRKEFWSLDLRVDARVLIPRPDTETLVELGRDILRDLDKEQPRVLDVGTGSGALALALKKECPRVQVLAVDVSQDALTVARANAERLGLDVTFAVSDLMTALPSAGPFDLIVSNPPYIPSAEIAGLSPEVRSEPRLALDGGDDGLALVRKLVAQAAPVLFPGGVLAMEIGAGQAGDAAALLTQAGYVDVGTRKDLAGIERVVFGRRARERQS
jgi:release factor glutamine methyltransferase